jgi:hypothetical protein
VTDRETDDVTAKQSQDTQEAPDDDDDDDDDRCTYSSFDGFHVSDAEEDALLEVFHLLDDALTAKPSDVPAAAAAALYVLGSVLGETPLASVELDVPSGLPARS